MNSFRSQIDRLDNIELPEYTNLRIMMMPIKFEDLPGSTPDFLAHWLPTLETLVEMMEVDSGTGYITIDEAIVEPGKTHRRPGLHVDGIDENNPDRSGGSWGGGSWGGDLLKDSDTPYGMLLVSQAPSVGCIGWDQEFQGWPKQNGDCQHLSDQCREDSKIIMEPGVVYGCSPLAVHDTVPLSNSKSVKRQFVRLSRPNEAPWYKGYTENPTGVEPAGPILEERKEEMSYRP